MAKMKPLSGPPNPPKGGILTPPSGGMGGLTVLILIGLLISPYLSLARPPQRPTQQVDFGQCTPLAVSDEVTHFISGIPQDNLSDLRFYDDISIPMENVDDHLSIITPTSVISSGLVPYLRFENGTNIPDVDDLTITYVTGSGSYGVNPVFPSLYEAKLAAVPGDLIRIEILSNLPGGGETVFIDQIIFCPENEPINYVADCDLGPYPLQDPECILELSAYHSTSWVRIILANEAGKYASGRGVWELDRTVNGQTVTDYFECGEWWVDEFWLEIEWYTYDCGLAWPQAGTALRFHLYVDHYENQITELELEGSSFGNAIPTPTPITPSPTPDGTNTPEPTATPPITNTPPPNTATPPNFDVPDLFQPPTAIPDLDFPSVELLPGPPEVLQFPITPYATPNLPDPDFGPTPIATVVPLSSTFSLSYTTPMSLDFSTSATNTAIYSGLLAFGAVVSDVVSYTTYLSGTINAVMVGTGTLTLTTTVPDWYAPSLPRPMAKVGWTIDLISRGEIPRYSIPTWVDFLAQIAAMPILYAKGLRDFAVMTSLPPPDGSSDPQYPIYVFSPFMLFINWLLLMFPVVLFFKILKFVIWLIVRFLGLVHFIIKLIGDVWDMFPGA